MTGEEKHRLQQAEFDRDGFERLLRQEQQARAKEKADLELTIKQREQVITEYAQEIEELQAEIYHLRFQAKHGEMQDERQERH